MTDADKDAAMWRLWEAVLARLLEAVAGPDAEPNASMLDTARRFLAQNNMSIGSRPDLSRGLRLLAEANGLPFAPTTKH
jgi:hypothetical protein